MSDCPIRMRWHRTKLSQRPAGGTLERAAAPTLLFYLPAAGWFCCSRPKELRDAANSLQGNLFHPLQSDFALLPRPAIDCRASTLGALSPHKGSLLKSAAEMSPRFCNQWFVPLAFPTCGSDPNLSVIPTPTHNAAHQRHLNTVGSAGGGSCGELFAHGRVPPGSQSK